MQTKEETKRGYFLSYFEERTLGVFCLRNLIEQLIARKAVLIAQLQREPSIRETEVKISFKHLQGVNLPCRQTTSACSGVYLRAGKMSVRPLTQPFGKHRSTAE